ncbi:MAG: hypothetical protein AAGD11_19035 [Planctomycetota bacterium]
MQRIRLLTLFLMGAIVVGCDDGRSVPPQVNQQRAEPDAGSEKSDGPDQSLAEPNEIVAVAPEAKSDAQVAEPERILLLARGGPLILDVLLTVDGESYERSVDSLVDRVLKAGDTDGDDRSTWDEWRQNDKFLRGELANLSPIRRRTVKNWVERYDENKDGRLQRAEAAAWLGRSSGRSVTGLRMRSSRRYGPATGAESRLWRVLDYDGDGRLHQQELKTAPERLLELDTDDNRVISSAELATLAEQLDAESRLRSSFERIVRRDAAVRLRTDGDASQLDYLLSDLYAPRQQLGPTSFSARAALFRKLDTDGDRLLGAPELAAMLTVEPHVTLAVDFDSVGDRSTLSLLNLSASTQAQVMANDRIIIDVQDCRINISADDLSSNESESSILDACELSIMIHDRNDGLFALLDRNADGRLGEREIAEARGRITETDADGDQQLAADELPSTMTIVFARGEPRGRQDFYVPRSVNAAIYDASTPPWFRHADHNADGDVSRSEFLGSAAQFSTLDQNQDGFITHIEAATAAED